MRDEALPLSLPTDTESLRKLLADREATDHDLRTRPADIRAMRLVARQADDPRPQSPEARAHLSGEVERLRSSLARPGVLSPTIRSCLSIPGAENFLDPAEYFRVMLRRPSPGTSPLLATCPPSTSCDGRNPRLSPVFLARDRVVLDRFLRDAPVNFGGDLDTVHLSPRVIAQLTEPPAAGAEGHASAEARIVSPGERFAHHARKSAT